MTAKLEQLEIERERWIFWQLVSYMIQEIKFQVICETSRSIAVAVEKDTQ
jgi:hypothetical protein